MSNLWTLLAVWEVQVDHGRHPGITAYNRLLGMLLGMSFYPGGGVTHHCTRVTVPSCPHANWAQTLPTCRHFAVTQQMCSSLADYLGNGASSRTQRGRANVEVNCSKV